MSPQLLHIYGPLFINVYGLFIAIGVGVALLLGLRDKKLALIVSNDELSVYIFYTILVAVLGGRLLFAFDHWNDLPSVFYLLQLWRPGYSVLGAVIAVVTFSVIYWKKAEKNPLKILDRIALYVPLAHSISRFGCYFAGCCYGISTHAVWAVTYTHPQHLAPLGIPLHPTQLYSALGLFILFLALFYAEKYLTTPGQLVGLYLTGTGVERFGVDFLRADRRLVSSSYISTTQVVALMIIGTGLVIFYRANNAEKNR